MIIEPFILPVLKKNCQETIYNVLIHSLKYHNCWWRCNKWKRKSWHCGVGHYLFVYLIYWQQHLAAIICFSFFSITRLMFPVGIVTKSHLKFVTISIEMERNMCSLSHSMVCSGCVNSEIKLSGHSHFPSSPRINVVISIALIGLMQRERSEAEGGAWLQTDPRR